MFSCLKGEITMSNSKTWKPEADEEAHSTEPSGVKSANAVPGEQTPLGSSVMTPDDTQQ